MGLSRKEKSAKRSRFALKGNASATYIGKPLHRFCKALDGFVCISVFDAVAHTVLDMAFQHNLPALMQGRFRRVDLGKDILAGNVLIHHAVDGLHLPDDFPEPAIS